MKAANVMRNSDPGLKRASARAASASAPVAPRAQSSMLGHRFAVGPISDETRSEIDKLARRGESVDVLATQFGRSRASILRMVSEMRVRRLMDAKLDGMYHESFDDPRSAAEITGPAPEPPDGKAPRKVRAPEGLPPYLADLYDATLLTREQEAHLFRKMNYLKHRAVILRDALDAAKPRSSDLDKIERLVAEALSVKNQIIKANLRLVVSIAKKHVNSGSDFFELISEGNMALIRAVEKFDFSRGNKFSTYASWAIMNRFARAIPEENHRRDRFVTGHEAMFESAADTRSDEHEIEFAARRVRETVNGMLGKLDARERRVLESRYGLGGASEQTLEQLGRELGITKERVRQIESRAQEKLRKIAGAQALELAS
jgi:RNA polymerase primary sigma factor